LRDGKVEKDVRRAGGVIAGAQAVS
jgi:hypothetical protein